MLKKDVFEHLGYVGEHPEGSAILAELLSITRSAVIMWGDLLPESKAKTLHKLFRLKKIAQKYNLSEKDQPSYDVNIYAKAIKETKEKRERNKYRELQEKFGGDTVKHDAFEVLKKAHAAKTNDRKAAILSKFVNSLT